jgi:colanic acid biosynthesis glycosyl transferase WcaI
MHLLVISQYFWPEDFRINELVAELVSRGHDVTVLTGRPNYPDGVVFPAFEKDPERFASYAGARVVRVPMLARGSGSFRMVLNYFSFAISASIFGVLHFARARFDAIFVFEPSPVTVGLPALALRSIHGWPIVFWVLDQWPETLAAVGVIRSRKLLGVVGWLVRMIYAACAIILTSSRQLIPRIASYCRPGQRIEYFPNWAEAAYETESADAAPEVAARPGVFNIMFAGNVGEAQDFPAILSAAECLKGRADIRWLIVGDGRMSPWVQSEVVRRGLTDRVIMLGRFPSERMPSFFQHADALLVSLRPDPIFTLTAPGKIQSYLSFGLPVLAMLDGEGAALIQQSLAGLTGPAGDAKRLAENVVQLTAMTASERSALGANGAAYAQREFDRSRLVDRLEVWLTEIAASRDTVGAR